MKYQVFWIYSANAADKPWKVDAISPEDAIRIYCKDVMGYINNKDFIAKAKFFVFEVGGDFVYNGPYPKD